MDVEVRDERGNFIQIVQNVRSKIDAKNKFAKEKGHKGWGDMVAVFKKNNRRKPPYHFYKKGN